MKKLVGIVSFALFLTSGLIFNFCNAENVSAADTYKITKNGITIYIADDQRALACNRMNQMANVEWSIPTAKKLTYTYASGSTVTLDAGSYKGLPYTQVERDYSNPTASLVQTRINDAINGTANVKGVDCSSAVAYAYRYATGNNNSDSTFLKGKSSAYVGACFFHDAMKKTEGTTPNGSVYRDNVTKVGYYGSYAGYLSANYTDVIVDKLASGNYYSTGDIFSNVYAKIKPGDALVTYPTDGNGVRHIVMVTDVELYYDGTQIDSSKSKVYITDQNGPSSKNIANYRSSWRTNYSISFNSLRNVYYLPLRLNEWEESYTISYDANGGVGAPNTQTKKQYEPMRISSIVPTKEGYTFKGWETSNDPIVTKYQPNDFYCEERTEILYAVWEKNVSGESEENSIIRYAGANRYETAFLAADGLKQSLGVDKFDNIIVASGDNYPDALAGSYLGKVKDAPILLVTGTTEKTTADYIKSNLKEGGTVYLLGGTGVVSSNFEKMVKASGVSVERLAGANRYDTNIAILKEAGVKSEDILVCSGSGYADSLSASAVGKPILLVDEKITAKQQSYLDTLSTKNMYLIGGTGAVSKAVEKDLNGYTLKRFAGANRFETSTMVAYEFFPKSECIVLAYGYNFPDGLSGGPLAMSIGAPLVLTSNESACVDTARNYAITAGVSKAVILGGRTLISDQSVMSIIN